VRHTRWLVCGLLSLAGPLAAQRGEGRTRPPAAEPIMVNLPYDGRYTFARIRFGGANGGFFSRGGMSWAHDYPRAEANFTKILGEVSTVGARLGTSSVVTLEDPALFDHTIAYIVEVGDWTPSETEAAALRRWMQRGGFLIVDDFQSRDWVNFEYQMGRVLPGMRLQPIPLTHPIFDAFYRITTFDQVRHPYSGAQTTFWGIFEENDPSRRLMMVANRDGDIAEFWEFSDQGFFPLDLSNEAYKLGINYIVYALTR
jgi:hypothetical protein